MLAGGIHLLRGQIFPLPQIGCPLTPRLMANPRKPLRVSASMSIAISTTYVPAIAFTRNRVSPCETRKIRAPYR